VPVHPHHRAVLLVLALILFAAAPARAAHRTHSLSAGILEDLNQIRRTHGLAPLKLSPGLSAAARAHSDEMLALGYFGHSSADGVVYWLRIEGYYHRLIRDGTWAVGENLFWAPGTLDVREAVRAWMRSPEHRHNILTPKWRQIGIGIRHESDAPGFYADLQVTVLTTDFGVR
jgi:uncharacterized protein YkwD